MSSPLQFKVYSGTHMVGALRYAEDAAALASNTLSGKVMWKGRIVWREGREEFPAGESFDRTAGVINERVANIMWRAANRRLACLEAAS